MQKPQLVAVDTNILLRLGDEDEEAIEAWQIIRARVKAVQFVIPPTVIAETVEKSRHDVDEKLKRSARRALGEARRRWQMHPFAPNAVQEVFIRNAARELRLSGLIPYEEVNDAFIVAEAATLDCILLVSNDSHLREIDHEKLIRIFKPLDLRPPTIRSMREIVRRFHR